ncbi:hypothetical protein [Bacillus chungangensis]|uniref:Uncharacterized protein n=1 Tax=Bacillus chungangensis TaxID=587633 RepID=A0ABT9WUR2_9BACI|nr:hypothetical protein [Bacillus chungangensis]MDQ0177024.1 hypothetical protein [Bacillus chungangensis]
MSSSPDCYASFQADSSRCFPEAEHVLHVEAIRKYTLASTKSPNILEEIVWAFLANMHN